MQIEWDKGGKAVKITMPKPADMHQHLRRGALLHLVAPMVARRFSKAIVMPNTVPPITTYEMVRQYLLEIKLATNSEYRSGKPDFWPLMTMYLTDTLEPHELRAGLDQKLVFGVKYYPRGLTTNSDSGIADPASLWSKGTKPYAVLRELADYNAVLLLHAADGFATDLWNNEGRFYGPGEELDPWDQEPHFICNTLPRIREAHPDLKISVEHLSTAIGADWLRTHGGDTLGCSLTAQHLLLDRRDVFRQGFRPHRFWWPIIQSSEHKEELCKLVAEGHPFVWLGSDSAPHPVGKKETDCCSGGVLMAHAGIELFLEAFEDIGCLHKLEDFACVNGPRFYGLKPSDLYITLVREEWSVAEAFYAEDMSEESGGLDKVVPFRLGESIRWKLVA